MDKELPPKAIEEMREAFRRAVPYLTSAADREGIPADEFQERVNAAVAQALGLGPTITVIHKSRADLAVLHALELEHDGITLREIADAMRKTRAAKGATS